MSTEYEEALSDLRGSAQRIRDYEQETNEVLKVRSRALQQLRDDHRRIGDRVTAAHRIREGELARVPRDVRVALDQAGVAEREAEARHAKAMRNVRYASTELEEVRRKTVGDQHRDLIQAMERRVAEAEVEEIEAQRRFEAAIKTRKLAETALDQALEMVRAQTF